jgi:hypothetical protein
MSNYFVETAEFKSEAVIYLNVEMYRFFAEKIFGGFGFQIDDPHSLMQEC